MSRISRRRGNTSARSGSWFFLMGAFALLLIRAWLMTSAGGAGGSGQVNQSGSTLYSLIVGPFAAIGAYRAAVLTNVVLLAICSVLAASVLQKRWGSSAPMIMVVYVFGSVVFARALIPEAQTLLLSSTVLAFVLISQAERPLTHDMPEMYHEPNLLPRVVVRWFLAGLLLAIPASHDPIYLCLFFPALASLPKSKKNWAVGSCGIGVLVLAGLLFIATDIDGRNSGNWIDGQKVQPDANSPTAKSADDRQAETMGGLQGSVRESAGRWLKSLERVKSLPDWGLLAWNGLYFLLGRNLGVIPFFLPVLLILAGWGSTRREAILIGSVVLAAFLALWLHPFNFSGHPGGLGNGRFLPLYGALWLLPTKQVSRGGVLAVTILAALFVWPLWASPTRAIENSLGTARYAAAIPFRFLPFEVSQSGLPDFGALRRQGMVVRSLTPSIEYDRSLDRLVLTGDRRGELLVSSEVELGSIFLYFAKSASAELEVSGGEVTDTIFRPDGRVAFQIGVDRPQASYPHAGSTDPSFHYRLGIRMDESEKATFSVKGVIIDQKPRVEVK